MLQQVYRFMLIQALTAAWANCWDDLFLTVFKFSSKRFQERSREHELRNGRDAKAIALSAIAEDLKRAGDRLVEYQESISQD